MRISVYSGSFNPLHIGHLAIMQYLSSWEGTDWTYLVVSPQNPLKDATAAQSSRDRYRAALAALQRHPDLRVWLDDIELRMPPPSYTIRTLDILRRQPEYRRIVADREWKRDLTVRSVRDSRITLLGTGDIGRETAVRLRAFSPAVITGVNRSGKNPGNLFDSILTGNNWEQVLPETDVLIISLPGTREAFHMVGEQQLSLLDD